MLSAEQERRDRAEPEQARQRSEDTAPAGAEEAERERFKQRKQEVLSECFEVSRLLARDFTVDSLQPRWRGQVKLATGRSFAVQSKTWTVDNGNIYYVSVPIVMAGDVDVTATYLVAGDLKQDDFTGLVMAAGVTAEEISLYPSFEEFTLADFSLSDHGYSESLRCVDYDSRDE